jgi:hypothetical protein
MRKLFIFGLMAASLFLFSSQALAGNVEACEVLKDKNADGYVPGLYGLCVAYHNASVNGDQTAIDRISGKFFERCGCDTIPGTGDPGPDPTFACPCWSELTLDYVCDLGAPLVSTLELVDPADPDLADVYEGIVIFMNTDSLFENFGVAPDLSECAHLINNVGPSETNLTPAEGVDCGFEIGEIANLNTSEYCQAGG